jgi:hypothetical protein
MAKVTKHEEILAAINKVSQRPRIVKKKGASKGTTTRPSARLKARRAANTKAGYFPNPTTPAIHAKLHKSVRAVLSAAEKEKLTIRKQALVSYAQGVITAAQIVKVFTAEEALNWRKVIKDKFNAS